MFKIAILAAILFITVTSYRLNNPCPDDVPIVMCNSPPCKGARNPVCKESFCGACKAKCYDVTGKKRQTCIFGSCFHDCTDIQTSECNVNRHPAAQLPT